LFERELRTWDAPALRDHLLILPLPHTALTAISQHPRCRLPRLEVHKRLEQWSL
jgi:hypothetical protein